MKKVFLVLILLVVAIFSFSAEIDTTFLSYAEKAADSISSYSDKAFILKLIAVEYAKAGQFDKAVNLINKKTNPDFAAYILISIHQGYIESNKKIDDNCKGLLEDIFET